MTEDTFFIEPLDVVVLRANRSFGAPGSYGETMVLPWPSVVSGALRSMLLAHDGVDLPAFGRGSVEHPVLGTPARPGPFTLAALDLARKGSTGAIDVLRALPADLVAETGPADETVIRQVRPVSPAPGMASSSPLAAWPVLAQPARTKPLGLVWLDAAGWQAYAAGRLPQASQLVRSSSLWSIETRVGVGLDAATGRASDGALFSTQAVTFRPGVGYRATVRGATLPQRAMLRLGGDGHAAVAHRTPLDEPQPPWETLCQQRRARIVLTTPGLFRNGWLLPGMQPDGRFELGGIRARVVCAAVPRGQTVSGWDLAQGRPKPAERVVPTGSVYWLDDIEASPEQLRKLVAHGLWTESGHDPVRRAEGFNRFTLAVTPSTRP